MIFYYYLLNRLVLFSMLDQSSKLKLKMAETVERYAVVTGANKGIGYEVVKQLASTGIKVVLTARDEKRGLHALETLKASESTLSDFILFHQLDVADPASVATLADFVKSKFGKLDILVNNAGIGGVVIKDQDLLTLAILNRGVLSDDEATKLAQTYELTEECLQINYYGATLTTKSLLPLLQLSDSPTIVNVSSALGQLESIPNEWAKGILSDVDNLTEEKVDQVLKKFLEDYKEGSFESKGWPKTLGAYIMSKAALNAYTRILAKKFPYFCINCLCPGYCKSDITANTGFLTVEEGASSVVRLALLPCGSPSGLFYFRSEVSSFLGLKYVPSDY